MFKWSYLSLKLLNLCVCLIVISLWQTALKENKINCVLVFTKEFYVIFFFFGLTVLKETIKVFEIRNRKIEAKIASHDCVELINFHLPFSKGSSEINFNK